MSQVEGEETVVDDDPMVNVSKETSVTFFDILCQHVEGEALMVIKSVEGFHGFEAWRRFQDVSEEITTAHGRGHSRQDQKHGRDPIGPDNYGRKGQAARVAVQGDTI